MGRKKRSANVGGLDEVFLSRSLQDSPFVYRGYRTATNYGWSLIEVDPTQQGGFGGKTVYDLSLEGDFIGKVVREIKVSPGDATNDTYFRYVDFLGHAITEKYVWKYGTNNLPEYTDLMLHEYYYGKVMSREEQETADDRLAGNKSPAERDALAQSEQVLEVEVPAHWSRDPTMYVHQHSLAQELRLTCTNRALKHLLDHDGVAGSEGAQITSEKLKVFYYSVNNKETNAVTSMHQIEDGLTYAVTTHQEIPQTRIASGNTTAQISLRNFTFPQAGLFVSVRKASDVDGTAGAGNTPSDYYNLQAIQKADCCASAGVFVEEQTDQFNRRYLQPMLFHSRPGSNIFYINFSFDPTEPVDSLGHLSIGNFTNPVLNITFNTALDEDHLVDVFGLSKEVVQAAYGDLQEVVN